MNNTIEEKLRQDGWIRIGESKPEPFDLVLIMDNKGSVQPVWWTGTIWDHGRKRRFDEVIYWNKKKVEQYDEVTERRYMKKLMESKL